MTDPHEVAPGLWIGSKRGDLYRERQILMSKIGTEDDQSAKLRIREITNELIQMTAARPFKKEK
jgi:hypothetical protein